MKTTMHLNQLLRINFLRAAKLKERLLAHYRWAAAGLLLGGTGSAYALPAAVQTAICTILDDMKVAFVVVVIIAVIIGWLSSKFQSDKMQDMVVGFVVGFVVLFSLIYGIKGTGWATSLNCAAFSSL